MQRAFTLVELAIVLAVISVVAAYVTPNFIELARGQLAERAAEDMLTLQDAARWFYHDSPGPGMDPKDTRWPGESAPGSCNVAGVTPEAELTDGNYITEPALTNPWDRPYRLDLWTPTPMNRNNCRFQIVTEVPAGMGPQIMSTVPLSHCERALGDPNACPGNPPSGFDLCCSRLVKPGFEASEDDVLASVCEHMLGGLWDAAAQTCDPYGNWDWGDCVWIEETTDGSICDPGKVVVGTRESSCGKYCQRTDYRCCEGRANN